MKTWKIGLATIVLLGLAIVPLTHFARAQSYRSSTWLNTVYSGEDPLLGSVYAYTTGTTATLNVIVDGYESATLTAYTLYMDWGNNYTGTLSSSVTQNAQISFSITFTTPSNSAASNLETHNCIYRCLLINYTDASKTKNLFFTGSIPAITVYSSDQASAISSYQQIQFLTSSFGISPCAFDTFHTSQGASSCEQAIQQANLGVAVYRTGDFATAKTDFQNAVNDWNSAINNENSQGGGVQFSSMLGGYGGLLLGLGGIIGGVAALLYAIRRPKELKAAMAHT